MQYGTVVELPSGNQKYTVVQGEKVKHYLLSWQINLPREQDLRLGDTVELKYHSDSNMGLWYVVAKVEPPDWDG